MTDINRDDLLEMRQDNIGRLFQRAARAYSELALEKFKKYGYDDLSLFHTALISNLDVEGSQISTAIAERAGVSKQAMGQLAKELEAKGLIQRVPDPSDKRAVLLKFTEDGIKFLEVAYQIKLEIESEYADIIGEENMLILRDLLGQLVGLKRRDCENQRLRAW